MATAPHSPDDKGKKDDKEHKDEHAAKPPEKKKKTPVAMMIGIALLTLAAVVFLMVENPLLAMFWSSFTESVRTMGNGLRDSGTELMRTSLSTRVFTQGLFSNVIALLLIALGLVGTFLIGLAVREYVKKKQAEAS